MISYLLGANGFIGSHLSKRLNAVAVNHQDIPDQKYKHFSSLFYLASYGNLNHQHGVPEIMKANVRDVLSTVEKVIDMDFHSFTYLSTSSVKLKRQTTYSRAKRAVEEILLAHLEHYNKPICIIRPFSVTGVGEQPSHLIPTLIRSCMEGELIDFVEAPTHDFIDIEDLVDGILNLSGNAARGIFELGTGKCHTNKQVKEIVEKVTGKKANVRIVSALRDYDNEQWVSTNFRSRGWGWAPKKSLELSIREMVHAYEPAKKEDIRA